jgi:hypothetical protein
LDTDAIRTTRDIVEVKKAALALYWDYERKCIKERCKGHAEAAMKAMQLQASAFPPSAAPIYGIPGFEPAIQVSYSQRAT